MLGARVIAIPGIDVPLPDGGTVAMPIACHQAACFWLYEEAHNEPPQGWAFTDGSFFDSTQLMTKLAKNGKSISSGQAAALAGGTVLIFTNALGGAEHTCIIRTDGLIGGYNQVSWFNTPGISHTFSTHALADIKWRAGKNHKVNLASGTKGHLIAIDENMAVNFIKYNF